LKKAFTLIELLIVVAIIAILAAIAVPNFLEAQTRAKIARVQSDQRTYSTALETYYIDNNSYPVYFQTGMKVGNGFPYTAVPANVNNYNAAIKLAASQPETPEKEIPSFAVTTLGGGVAIGLTTPVSYLNTYPADAFANYKGATFAYVQGTAGFIVFSPGADGSFQLDADTANASVGNDNAAEYIVNGGQSLPSPFLLTGPTGSAPKPTGYAGGGTASFTYDATNGTASAGDVYKVKG